MLRIRKKLLEPQKLPNGAGYRVQKRIAGKRYDETYPTIELARARISVLQAVSLKLKGQEIENNLLGIKAPSIRIISIADFRR